MASAPVEHARDFHPRPGHSRATIWWWARTGVRSGFWMISRRCGRLDAEVAAADAFLFKPQAACRVRRSVNTDTPIPPEEPMGQNPPDGAIINYYLKSGRAGSHAGNSGSRRQRSCGAIPARTSRSRLTNSEQPYPTYWFRPPRILSAKAGMQRFVWDLHYPPPEGEARSYPISAIYHDTPTRPAGADRCCRAITP